MNGSAHAMHPPDAAFIPVHAGGAQTVPAIPRRTPTRANEPLDRRESVNRTPIRHRMRRPCMDIRSTRRREPVAVRRTAPNADLTASITGPTKSGRRTYHPCRQSGR